MIRIAAGLVCLFALIVPTSGGAAANEAARLSYSVSMNIVGTSQERLLDAGLCLAGSDGAEGDRLTKPTESDRASVWSPDGRSLAFSRGRSGLYVQDERGVSRKIIEGDDSGWGPGAVIPGGWSPDGQRIVYLSAGIAGYLLPYSAILTVRSDGTDRRLVTSAGLYGSVSDPAWSPDGHAIAFADSSYESGGLYLIDPDGTNRRLLAPSGGQPSWSPDGASIVFTRQNESSANVSDLMIIGADGRGQRTLTSQPGAEENPAWSPDGNWIAFEQRAECGGRCGGGREGTDIALIRPDGTGLHVVRGSSLAELDPAWRPPAPSRPGPQRPCVLRGTDRAETIRGSSHGDFIFAGRGRDRISGGGGGDLIDGGLGPDRILGGPGNDLLYTFDGRRDVVGGGSGQDEAKIDNFDRISSVESACQPNPRGECLNRRSVRDRPWR